MMSECPAQHLSLKLCNIQVNVQLLHYFNKVQSLTIKMTTPITTPIIIIIIIIIIMFTTIKIISLIIIKTFEIIFLYKRW